MSETHDDAEALVERVREALKNVIDPELGYNVVDLGLIYGIDSQGRDVHVVMTLTTPGCPAANYIEQGVYTAASAVDGVDSVDVALVWSPRWGPEMMSDIAKEHFGFA